MRYALERMELLIKRDLLSAIREYTSELDTKRAEILTQVNEEKERLRKEFINAAYRCKQKHVFEQYIHHHQKDLTALADYITDLLPPYSKVQEGVLLQTCISKIDDLLDLLRSYFNPYFDDNASLPKHAFLEDKSLFETYITNLSSMFEANNIDIKLGSIILQPYMDYTGEKEGCCTFHLHDYLKAFYANLTKESSEPLTNDVLKDKLFNLDFNSYRFFSFCIDEIKYQLNESIQPDKVITLLLKETNQRVTNNKQALYTDRAPLKEMISAWLEEEAHYYFLQKPKQAETNEAKYQGFKVKLNLAVDDLSYFLLLFKEAGVLDTNNKKALAMILAEYCSTKERNAIQWKRLYNRTYDVSERTKDNVKGLLIKMVNQIIKNDH